MLPMKVAVPTLGCKANQYDSACMEELMRQRGWEIFPPSGEADVYIVNTCTVTSRSDTQCKQLLRRLRREHGNSLIIATGCYAQTDPESVAGVKGIDAVLGLQERCSIADTIEEIKRGGNQGTPLVRVGSTEGSRFWGPVSYSIRTRAFFKVQDGCDMRCTFCIVPKARGRSRSLEQEKVLDGIKSYQERGIAEVVITGIHLGGYGRDLSPKTNLGELVRLIKTAGPRIRIRLSSLDPQEVTLELLDLIASTPSMCRHIHISLQSGDRSILSAMDRPSLPDVFSEAVLAAKRKMPDVCIGADVIAGFPGESENAFNNTYRLLDSLPVSYLHVFPFSVKRGTPAADMPGQVQSVHITRRAEQLRALGLRKRMDFYKSFIGETVNVLLEKTRDRRTGALAGYTSNYIRVLLNGPDDLAEKEVPMVIKGIENGIVWGMLAA